MAESVDVERSVYEGPGKIISARNGGQIYPNLLAHVDKVWMFVAALGTAKSILATGDSIVSVFKQVIRPLTTGGLRDFLNTFELTLQDMLKDNFQQTDEFIRAVCTELAGKVHVQKDVSPKTLRNMQEWADSLTEPAGQPLKKVIEETIAKLKALPEVLTAPPVKKPTTFTQVPRKQ